MTGGGPGFATTTLEFYGYQQGFATGDFGAAATAGVMLFVAVQSSASCRCGYSGVRKSDDYRRFSRPSCTSCSRASPS